MPPEELASWGSKKICDPENLRIFSTLKSRAVANLDKMGVRFLGGWALPEALVRQAFDLLSSVRDEFMAAKQSFLNSYDQAVQAWVDKHPVWKNLIVGSQVSADYVESRLNFNWQFYKVKAPTGRDFSSQNLIKEVENLGTTLFDEIAKEAKAVWNKVYAGKTEVSHKALSPLRTIQQKLKGLCFVEPRVTPVADIIETALVSMPKRGLIRGTNLIMLQGLVNMLSEPDILIEHGQKVIEGQSFESVLNIFTGQTTIAHSASKEQHPTQTSEQYLDSLGLW